MSSTATVGVSLESVKPPFAKLAYPKAMYNLYILTQHTCDVEHTKHHSPEFYNGRLGELNILFIEMLHMIEFSLLAYV